MATKELLTRIALKYDSYENWTKDRPEGSTVGKNLVLLKGEIGICEIPSNFTANGDSRVMPTVLFKVGNGTSKFHELPWASAKAADVYGWAKSETVVLAEQDATVDGKTVKKQYLQFKTGTTVNHSIDLSSFATDAEVESVRAALAAKISALETSIGDSGNVGATVADHESRLGIIEGADTVDGSIAKALKDAKDYADSLAGNYDAEGSAAAAEQNAKDYADDLDEAMGKRVDGVAADLSEHEAKVNPHGVTAELLGLGKVENKTVAEIKTEFTGAVAANNEDFVTGGAAHTAIEAAKAAANTYADGLNTAMDTRVDALEAAKTAQDTTNENLTKSIADEKSARETAVSGEATARDNADKAIEAKIGTVTEGKTVVKMIEDAQTAATTAAASDAAAKVKALEDGKVAANASEISRVEGLVTAEVKAREDADKAIDERLVEVEAFFKTADNETLDTALDTLKEIQDYLNGEGNATDGIIGRVAQAETDIDNLQAEFNEGGRVKAAEGKISALEAKDTELSAAIDTKLATSDFNTWKGTHENDHAPSATQIASDIADAVADEADLREAADALINEKFGADYSKDATVASAIADAKAAGTGAASEATRAHGRLDIVEPKVTTLQDLADGYTGKGSIKTAVDAAQGDATQALTDAAKAQGEIDALELVVGNETTGLAATKVIADRADAKSIDNASRLDTAEGKITTLEGKVAANEGILADLDKNYVSEAEFTAFKTENSLAIKAADDAAAAADAKAADNASRIKAIEDDYLTQVDAFIFNCGSATEVVHVKAAQ